MGEKEEEKRRAKTHQLSCVACREDGRGNGKECVVSIGEGERITQLVVGGMTCASCLGAVSDILSKEAEPRIKEVEVTLLPGRAIVRHEKALGEEELVRMLEEGGYDAEVVESRDVVHEEQGWVETRMVIDGMTCSCVLPCLLRTYADLATRTAPASAR